MYHQATYLIYYNMLTHLLSGCLSVVLTHTAPSMVIPAKELLLVVLVFIYALLPVHCWYWVVVLLLFSLLLVIGIDGGRGRLARGRAGLGNTRYSCPPLSRAVPMSSQIKSHDPKLLTVYRFRCHPTSIVQDYGLLHNVLGVLLYQVAWVCAHYSPSVELRYPYHLIYSVLLINPGS